MKYLPVWKEAPFLRLVIPFIVGIGVQWYLEPGFAILCILAITVFIVLFIWYKSNFIHFRYYWIRGILLNVLLVSMGCIITVCRDCTLHKNSIGLRYIAGDWIVAKLEEPLLEKPNSYQVKASIQYLISENSRKYAQGMIVLYIQKEGQSDSALILHFGDQIIFRKRLQSISFTGNPGAFDYQRYCRLQQIRFSVFLGKKEWMKLPWHSADFFQRTLIHTREKILNIIRRYLSGGQETGLAEALLIGYRNDLDRDLSLAYSNTGVVHIIAISGLHLALIYELLAFCLRPLRSTQAGEWMRILIIVLALWGFSFLSGASPSVLRSAMMFTCLAIGEGFSKKASIYNNLSASAFLLLCYNPYWLWDIGFQLSYTAVLSIVIFMKPIYKQLFFHNRIGDFVWKSVSVTLAAQVLTVPLCIYQFHQFPIYFLPANLIAVPLSSLILVGELLVCATAFIPFIARMIGHVLYLLLWLLNHFILYTSQLPFSTWNGLEISIPQCGMIYLVIAGLTCWYLYQDKKCLVIVLLSILSFTLLRSISFFEAADQERMVVYNVPRHQVIDCIEGRKYFLKGDSDASINNGQQNSCCQPARLQFRTKQAGYLVEVKDIGCFFTWSRKRILVIDRQFRAKAVNPKIRVYGIVLSKNPHISIQSLETMFTCERYIFDASNKIQIVKSWQKECEARGLSYHNIAAKGAFVMNMD